ncbi:uncharacterized protein B0H18DRAFT_986715 [Fomitopsis serialis]|uniref:uncharacterized protein n=1 Tax=Fomitopsis serialis TaxID=139415 RepID=UPI002007A46C|nr:uncharacterized protein B0H18DRAFT_986715 [Neoantrodia serialis]KAH9932625.1 hypothetical protein B0H18DRAFT_986715 [Neoantrodia serialis]
MTVVVELIVVDLKEGTDKENTAFRKLREGAAKGGLKASHFEDGFELKDFSWPTDEYGDFDNELKKIAASDVTRHFLTFPSFSPAVTAAPVTETVILTLKEDADLAAFKAFQDGAISKLKEAPVVHGAAYAITTEAGANPIVVLFVGWDSAEAHQAIAAAPESQALLGTLYAFIEKGDLVHVSYSKRPRRV